MFQKVRKTVDFNQKLAQMPMLEKVLYIFFSFIIFCLIANPLVAFADVVVKEGDPDMTLEGLLIGAEGVAVDGLGNIYIADTQNHVIRKYNSKGTPTLVFGREAHAGDSDGSPVNVRFNLPTKLASSVFDEIFVVERGATGQSRIRSIDTLTLETRFVSDLAEGVDGTSMLDVTTGLTLNKGMLQGVEIGDIAASIFGNIFVSATDLPSGRLAQYLILVDSSGVFNYAAATTSVPPLGTRNGARGIAIDRFGNIYTSFTGEVSNGDVIDTIYKFSIREEKFSKHFSLAGVGVVRAMGTGLGEQLYFSLEDPTGLIQVISTVDPDTTLQFLQASSNNSVNHDSRVRDVTGDWKGNLFAINDRDFSAGSATITKLSKLDRFAAVDISSGSLRGDTVPPVISISNLINNTKITMPTEIEAMASDNADDLIVQFQLDGKNIGPQLVSPPYVLALDPKLLISGSHSLIAIAIDGSLNVVTSDSIEFISSGGLPNTEGEVFLNDVELSGIPAGIAIGPIDKVYVAQNNGLEGHVHVYSFLNEKLNVFGLTQQTPFRELAGMGNDFLGNILLLDRDSSVFHTPRIHRFNPEINAIDGSLTLNQQLAIDVTKVWNFDTQSFENLLESLSICNIFPQDCVYVPVKAVDIAAAPNQDLLVGVEGQVLPQADSSLKPFLVRISANTGNRALAKSNAFRGGSGVTVDSNGSIFTGFPTVFFNNQDILAGFPANEVNPVGEGFAGFKAARIKGMGKDSNDRIFVGLDADPGQSPGLVSVFESAQPRGSILTLKNNIFDKVGDVATDSQGNVYVTSYEPRAFLNGFPVVSRVTRFAEALNRTEPLDTDNDGFFDDGNNSGFIGDDTCSSNFDTLCDDNCPLDANPDQADNDGDGIGDICDEIQDCDIKLDTDEDGLSDCAEIQFGTDPLLADTDHDGLIDSLELGLVEVDEDFWTITDPLNPDSDGDGLFDGNNGVNPCEDCNNNGKVDAGETDPNFVDDVPLQKLVHFSKGFNLFSYPGEVSVQDSTCFGLFNKIGTADEVDSISRLDTTSQTFESCNEAGGIDFPIIIGAGYIVEMHQAKDVIFNHNIICPSVVLQEGLNIVGHPSPGNLFSCFDILVNINNHQGTTVQRFNLETGRFDFCTHDSINNTTLGNDFDIVSGEGYFVNQLQASNLSLLGCN